jgi:hypothetical protein
MSRYRAHSGTCDQILLSVRRLFHESCCLVSVGRLLWRKVRSVICLSQSSNLSIFTSSIYVTCVLEFSNLYTIYFLVALWHVLLDNYFSRLTDNVRACSLRNRLFSCSQLPSFLPSFNFATFEWDTRNINLHSVPSEYSRSSSNGTSFTALQVIRTLHPSQPPSNSTLKAICFQKTEETSAIRSAPQIHSLNVVYSSRN